MSARLFDIHVVVDWSARSAPSPARPVADAIWWAVADNGVVAAPVHARTRDEAAERLAALVGDALDAGRRVLMGFDFPFGYPRGVAERVTGKPHAFAVWDWLAARVNDRSDNANTRFAAAEAINACYNGTGPFWGRPAGWNFPGIPVAGTARAGSDHPPERRLADARAKGAKTVWQLAYSGSVGSQVMLGLPVLKRIREHPRLAGRVAVWPFDGGLSVPDAPAVLAEIYPSLLRDDISARRADGEVLDSAQVRVSAEAFARLDAAGGLKPLFAGLADLDPADREAIETEEAWILGLGHEAALRDALKPVAAEYERDPKRIYARSFATVRAEARLDCFGADEAELAIRLIHACGMTDLTDDLIMSEGVVAAARAALVRGAPVLCDCEMVASGIIRRALPAGVEVRSAINDPAVPAHAARIGNTRSAAAMDLLRDRLGGAVVAVGNAPTALYRLLEMIDDGAPRPAAILGFPVGFVGAAEAKAALAADPRGIPFACLKGRRGGSAMAAAAVNAVAMGLKGDGT